MIVSAMSMNRQPQFIHPFNYYIVSWGVEAFHRAFVEDRYIDAIQNLYIFTGWLEPEIRKKLSKEMAELEMMMLNPKLVNIVRLRQIQLKVSELLHQAGYFTQAKIKEVPIGYEKGLEPPIKTEE